MDRKKEYSPNKMHATPDLNETKKVDSATKKKIRFNAANACFQKVTVKPLMSPLSSDRYRMSKISEGSNMTYTDRSNR